jgi:hypothetical protein
MAEHETCRRATRGDAGLTETHRSRDQAGAGRHVPAQGADAAARPAAGPRAGGRRNAA